MLPQFRQRRSGVVINVTSSVTLRPLHLLSVYTASKAAVNAFTESLALELAVLRGSIGRLLITTDLKSRHDTVAAMPRDADHAPGPA